MHSSVIFKLQLYHLVFSTISLVICFTTMSVIRNFPYYSRILYSEKPFPTWNHVTPLPPILGAERLASEHPPPPFSLFFFFFQNSVLILLNLGLQALNPNKPSNFMAESIHSCCEASYVCPHWMSHMGNGLQKVARPTSKWWSPVKYWK